MKREVDIFRPWSRSPRSATGNDFFGLINDFLGGSEAFGADTLPAVDVNEVNDHYVLSVDLPGVKQEDIKINIEGNQLSISAERKDDREEKNKGRQLSERFYGVFIRTFTLPSNVDTDKIEATCENGVLKIAVPKGAGMRARQINVSSGRTGIFDRLLGDRNKTERPNVRKVSNE